VYAVIFWLKEDVIQILKDSDGGVWKSEYLDTADRKANEIEDALGIDCRVISLDGVEE
jgi:hypothetical protein